MPLVSHWMLPAGSGASMAANRSLRVRTSVDRLHAGIDQVRTEQKLPVDFPVEVEAEAARVAAAPVLPDLDRTDIPLRTIDPAGAMDLDQALYVEPGEAGWRVYYAIADVAAFVRPGSQIDLEANQRGETLYGADVKVPLHPKVLSEGAASLLPDQIRPALLWTMELDRQGECVAVDVRRARVRSRARHDYDEVQQQMDAGDIDPVWSALRQVGQLRIQREQAQGGVSLPLPEQEMDSHDGRWTLSYRARRPVEDWNEQISLLTGMAAAQLMLRHKVGLLRTLPPPEPWMIAQLRRTAAALELAWPEQTNYQAFVRSLDPVQPRAIAMMVACTGLLRGAGYVAFQAQLPEQTRHWALAAEYAHVTAPLRRLVDRYCGEVCVAVCAGQPVPDWVVQALPGLPATMQKSAQRAGRFERAVVDLAEAMTLDGQQGRMFQANVVAVDEKDPRKGTVMLPGLAIQASVASSSADLPLGDVVQVRLAAADPATREVRFQID